VADIGGTVYNDQGKAGATFTDRLTATSAEPDPQRRLNKEIVYNYRVYLPPGIYQMRVAARDPASGKVGSAYQWIEIPNLSTHQLALSSLITGERPPDVPGATNSDQNLLAEAPTRVDHRFHRNSFLRFVVYVYNASVSTVDFKPDVAAQVQVLRDGQPVVTTASRRVSSEGNQQLDRLPYGADVSLEGLGPGRYVLRVSVVDRIGKTSAAQEMRFEVQ
jgi:hypothetical protein